MNKNKFLFMFLMVLMLCVGAAGSAMFFSGCGQAAAKVESASDTVQKADASKEGEAAANTIDDGLSEYKNRKDPIPKEAGNVEKRLAMLIDEYKGKQWKGRWYGRECKGFANLIFYRLFNVEVIGIYDETYGRQTAVEEAKEVGYINKKSKKNNRKMTKSSMKKLMKKGMPGDYIQVRREEDGKAWPHTYILIKTKKDGIKVLDCNKDGKNTVNVYSMKWDELFKKCAAMSLYHAEKYE